MLNNECNSRNNVYFLCIIASEMTFLSADVTELSRFLTPPARKTLQCLEVDKINCIYICIKR